MSYRKIFSVVNEHSASTVTARYAISLAAACKAELVFYAAHAEGADENIRHYADRHLEHLFTVAAELEIPVRRLTEQGSITALLPKRVQAETADLVLYPLPPDEQYGTRLQQQTIDKILRAVRPDLAIMRVVSMAKPHPRQILVPFGKFISDRERRLMFITDLAKSFHAQVTLFHLAVGREAKGMPADIIQFRDQLQQQDVTVLERSGTGAIGKAIAVEAITRHNDLIVLGASERGAVRRLLQGNPAGDVMRQPPCNTILFRAGETP